MNILLTNPTGRIGRRILPELLAPEFCVRVIVRDPARLPGEIRKQVEVVRGSSDDAKILCQALEGADALFWCVPTESPQETDVERYYERFACAGWQAIRRAGTPRVVTISAVGKGRARKAGSISGLHAMEEIFDDSGASIRHLRCGLFMDNFLGQVDSILGHGTICLPMPGHMPIPIVAVKDIADVALRWLVKTDWNGVQGIPVHGPQALSLDQVAGVIARVLERPVRYRRALGNEYMQTLAAIGASTGFAQAQVEMFAELARGIALAEPGAIVSTTPTTLDEWVRDELVPLVEVLGSEWAPVSVPVQNLEAGGA